MMLLFVKVWTPLYEPLHADPRFPALLKKLGLDR
jgi:hypothetical protein